METKEIEVNRGTCAIISLDKEMCKIINESEKEQVLKMPTIDIIEYGCRFFGSSFAGRVEGSKFLLGSCYKLPIIIEEQNEMIFFPTHSYRNEKCAWISLNHINEYKKDDYGVKLKFNNGKIISLPISFESFEAQFFRATKLLLTLRKRKQKK